jgi:FkbM family methyltransferase
MAPTDGKASLPLWKKAWLRLARPARRFIRFRPGHARKAFGIFERPFAALAYHLELKGIGAPMALGIRGGGSFRVATGDEFGCLWSCWVDEEYPLRGDEALVFDAGANLGAFSLYAARKCPGARIHALEPMASTFARLKANLDASPWGARVSAVRAGIAASDGIRAIYSAGQSPYSGFYAGGPAAMGEQVEVLGLAGWLAGAGDPPRVDVLKMDCEGAEMEALLGAEAATLRRFDRIGFEFHGISGIPYAKVEAHLEAAGFERTSLRREPAYGTGIAWFRRAGETAR